jgi:hypothetical protein
MNETSVSQELIPDNFEKLFYQLLDMLDRQTQDRQLLVKEKEELVKLTQLLINQTKEIGQYENGIRKRIQDCIRESANVAADHIEKLIVEKTIKSTEEFTKNITEISRACVEKNKFSWRIISFAILAGILTSFLTTWILIPKPVLPLTSEQINYLQEGQILEQVWPKMTKQERNRFKEFL